MARRLVASVLLTAAALALTACGVGGVVPIKEVLGGGSPDAPAGATMSATETSYAQQVLALVNEQRTLYGLEPVAWSDAATAAAYGHAVDMDRRNFFDHVNPDGHDPGWRLLDAGVVLTGWGENIAVGQTTPHEVMDAWMNSPGHRANILEPAFQRLGIGVHLGGDGPWWVQDFVR